MNVYVFYYEGFCDFEVSVALQMLRKENIYTVALETKTLKAEDNRNMTADFLLKEVNPDNVDLFLIPGGNGFRNEELESFLRTLDSKEKVIGGICGGSDFIYYSGILKERNFTAWCDNRTPDYVEENLVPGCKLIKEDVIVDKNIITAQGNAFIEFGVEVAHKMGLVKTEEKLESINWFKNIK